MMITSKQDVERHVKIIKAVSEDTRDVPSGLSDCASGPARAAHLERELYTAVLKAIARGQGRHVGLARAALETQKLDLRRT